MEQKINIAEILKDAPKGFMLYSIAYGKVEFLKVTYNNVEAIIKVRVMSGREPTTKILTYTQYGVLGLSTSEFEDLLPYYGGSWVTFNAPWKLKHFEPFQKVLVNIEGVWSCDIYSHFNKECNEHTTITFSGKPDNEVIPYEGNESLVGKEVKDGE